MDVSDRQKWDAKYRARGAGLPPASAFVLDVMAELPRTGACLDVAGGAGRQAIPMALHGLDVTVADVSPQGLRLAERNADEAGASVTALEWDVEADGLPPGPWDVIVCVHFLHRPLFEAWADALAPGGTLIFEHPTRSNLARHPKPSERYLLGDDELPSLIDDRLEIMRIEAGWGREGRHEARLMARLSA